MANRIVAVTEDEVIRMNIQNDEQFYDYIVTKMIRENRLDLEAYQIIVKVIRKHLFNPKNKEVKFLIQYDLKYKHNFFKRMYKKVIELLRENKQGG